MTIVEVQGVTLVRGESRILSDVWWAIQRGQHWALLGANGSGKTTLLKVITGYEWPSAGEVMVLGQRYGDCDLRELRKRVGWVSAAIEQRLPGKDTSLEVVVSGLEASMGLYREFSDAEWRRGREALGRLGCEGIAERPFGLLSQGEQQRVLIARGLVSEPALMILDEPCAGLDPAAREAFLEDLSKLARAPEAPTLILVTHHVEEIGPWISHVLVLKRGRALARGEVAAVLTSAVLSEAFGRRCNIERKGGRYHLRVERAAK